MPNKRKIDVENREFNDKWESTYLFTANSVGKPQCVVCFQVISVMKEYNIKRHYETNHKADYDKYVGEARSVVYADLRKKLKSQQQILVRPSTTQLSALHASYAVCLELAKSKKPFTDGEIIKRCAIEMARSFNDENMVRNFRTVSLSHQTVARRLVNMNEQVCVKLTGLVNQCKYFSIALDESTDVADISQLLVFAKVVDSKFVASEELLDIIPLNFNTKAVDIHAALSSLVDKYGGFDKCSCVVTDGARAMTGKKNGLVGLLKGAGVKCYTFHCIIHQEALCGRFLKMNDAMKVVVRIINLIRGGNRAHRHRKFISFIEELDSEIKDLSLHTDVRWLSAGKCLKQFFALRKDIAAFLKEEISDADDSVTLQAQLENDEFLCALAFLTDITCHLNTLNMQLQGRNQNVAVLVGHIDGFRKKLELFGSCVRNNDVTHFPSCHELTEDIQHADFCSYSDIIESLSTEFASRFSDFDLLREDIRLFCSPMDVTIAEQSPSLQMELCDLQADSFMQGKKHLDSEEFWRLVSGEKYPKLNDFALRFCSLMGSTYVCESAFSIMKHIKSKTRSRLDSQMLSASIRLALTEIPVDISSLTAQATFPQCSH